MRKNLQLNRWAPILVLTVSAGACAGLSAPKTTVTEPSQVDLRTLWVEPADLGSRNLFDGPGGRAAAPPENGRFEILAEDTKGYSSGYDVRGPEGVKWSV